MRFLFSAREAAREAAIAAHERWQRGEHVTKVNGHRVEPEYWGYVVNAAVRVLEQRLPHAIDAAGEVRALERVRQLQTDPCAAEVAGELSKRSGELEREGSPKRYTYNKLWHLIVGGA